MQGGGRIGQGGVQESSTHNLFDRMPSQHKVFKDDERIAEPVPIKSTMNKEGISMDEALDRILERFELMEANRRQEGSSIKYYRSWRR